WTDHVADAGAQATDPLDGGAAAGAPGDEPTWRTEPTAPAPGDQATQVDPTPGGPSPAYPAQGASTQEYPAVPGAGAPPPGWQGAAPPPPAPASRRRLAPALIVVIAVAVVALIGGVAFALTRNGDEGTTDAVGTADDAGEAVDGPPEGGDDPGGGAGGTGPGVTLPGGLGQEVGSESELIDLMAQSITQASGGQITLDEAECMSQAMVDRLGFEKLADMGRSGSTNPFEGLTPEEQG